MKVLILGGNGLLGSALKRRWENKEREFTIFAPGREKLDGCSEKAAKQALDGWRPQWVVNCAAATEVDRCERETAWAQRLNEGLPRLWAELCKERGCGFLQVSTDYVFDGRGRAPLTEADRTAPVNVYGSTKLAGERAALEAGGCALRVQWLYGRKKPGFVGWLCRQEGRGKIPVVNDCTGIPTSAKEAAAAIEALICSEKRGLWHGAPSGQASWMEFAREILRQTGGEEGRLVPIRQEELRRPAQRPLYTPLSSEKLVSQTLWEQRSWQEGLEEYLWEQKREKEGLLPSRWFD